jgi:peptide deformylase
MSVKKVLLYPAKELREESSDIEDLTSEEFLSLMQDLADTVGTYGAMGLSAPQIGVRKNVFVTNVDGKLQYFINPRITRSDGSITSREGCLSFPNVFELIDRFNEITIEAIDVDGREFNAELSGPDAVVAQHEFDHLSGVLFIDKVSAIKRGFMLKKLQKVKKKFNLD